MIEYIKGRIEHLDPATAIVETAGGVAYELSITLSAYSAIQSMGGEIRIYVHEIIREDQWVLYGFLERGERELFRLLIGVSGVGAGTARLILSAIPADQLRTVIASGDDGALKAVKGVGAKTAQRIIVDLKDKIKDASATLIKQPTVSTSANREETLMALMALGYTRQVSQKAVDRLYKADPTLSVEVAVKQALSIL